jgi:hypothetical protein
MRSRTANTDHEPVEALITRAGSPRPGGSDRRSRAIFGSGPFSILASSSRSVEAFTRWFEKGDHEAHGSFGVLENVGCERPELGRLVMATYVLPLDAPVSERRLRSDGRAVGDVWRRLAALAKTGVVELGGVAISWQTLLALQAAEQEIGSVADLTHALKGRRVMESVVLARLMAFVHVRDWQRRVKLRPRSEGAVVRRDPMSGWHDFDVGLLVTTCLGGTLADPAKARAEFRRRNGARIRAYERSYAQGTLPERDTDPDDPWDLPE